MQEKIKQILKRQHYGIAGKHSAVQICRWAKKSILGKEGCYKQKFYGIKSHQCCQMTPGIWCQNKCLHCWRALELTFSDRIKNVEKPDKIIQACIEQQKKMLSGFGGNKNINKQRFKEAQMPRHFAISLAGEPTLYPYLGEMIQKLREKGMTSFVVTNGLNPKALMQLQKKKQLPTQLYLSVNAPNKEIFNKIVRSKLKNAWKNYLETAKLFPKLKTRRVLRLTLIKGMNMEDEKGYAKLIKLAKPDFVEAKSYMAVGFSRQRLGYDKMPLHSQVKDFAKKIAKLSGLKVLDEKADSRVVLLGKSRKGMKIKFQ